MDFEMKIDIADLDTIYLSYDEPNKEETWVKIKNMVPWAVRVDGVKGSDAAHKAAADAASTDRFILIDGDNIPDDKFFNLTLDLQDRDKDCVFRWRAKNHINGLMYGNGGLSCWTKDFVYNMKTHEATDGTAENDVEFCFDPKYIAMHDCYSTTYPNATPFQAWRAGFREGVKMCLNKGARPTLEEFKDRVHHRNLDHLTIWHNVGRDVEHGIWAITGARMGTYMTMITPEWDYKQVQSFDALAELYKTIEGHDPEIIAGRVAEDLVAQLDLPITMMYDKESAFFKHHYRNNWHNQGVMVREMDVIRGQEGW
jgi:hypothetical protein